MHLCLLPVNVGFVLIDIPSKQGGSPHRAYSDQIVHPFRTIPSTGSEGNHPVIPKLTVKFFGA